MKIEAGDYIDATQFTYEQCERFCELAVASGHKRGEWMDYYDSGYQYLGLSGHHDCQYIVWSNWSDGYTSERDITAEFREYLKQPLKLTLAEIAKKFGVDSVEIVEVEL